MICVLGSINLDLVATCDRLPLPGETLAGHDFTTAAGGKGANQALAALRAGADMRMVGAVGKDAFADQALAELQKDNADLSAVRYLDTRTGIAMILVDGHGENVIIVVAGANGLVDAGMAQNAVAQMGKGDILLLQQEISAASVDIALDQANAAGITSMLNIAPFTADSAALAVKANFVIANETEFAGWAGQPLAGEALPREMAQMARTNGQAIIVTLGADGVIAASADGEIITVPAMAIEPVDTVGAGDSFCGYFAAAMDKGLGLEAALKRAAIAGALACLKPGAQPAIPYGPEVDAVDAAARNNGSK